MMRIALPIFIIGLGFSSCFGQLAFSNEMMADPQKFATEFEDIFTYREVPVFTKGAKEKSVLLKNGYASSVIQLPVAWPLKLKQYHVKEVRVVFTKYPLDKNFWNTNYYELLAARLQAAFSIDPNLNDSKINYSLVLQTQCATENDAKLKLHAIEVVFEIGVRPPDDDDKEVVVYDTLYNSNPDSVAWVRNMGLAWRYLKKSKVSDTVVLSGLDVFGLSDSLLIVIDCTGSMAPYYSQVSLWAARNFYPGHYYVMFNDGGKRTLPMGATGGYVDGRVNSVSALIKLFKKSAAKKGANKEVAENDIEGLMVGLKSFPNNKGVILIADNAACIRDYKLLVHINQPINIIPCGGAVLNPHYLNLAWYTGGSVYWQGQLYRDWKTMCTTNIFSVGTGTYRFLKKQQRFDALDDQGVHVDFCDALTPKIKKKQMLPNK